MMYVGQLLKGLRWISEVQRWTVAVAGGLAILTIGWVIAVFLGITTISQSPGEVVIAFYDAVQERRFDDAMEYLSEAAKTELAALSISEYDELMGELSHNFESTELDYLGVQNFGKTAVTGVLQDVPPDEYDLRVEVLVKEGRYWRIEWPLGVADWFESIEQYDPAARFRTPRKEPLE